MPVRAAHENEAAKAAARALAAAGATAESAEETIAAVALHRRQLVTAATCTGLFAG